MAHKSILLGSLFVGALLAIILMIPFVTVGAPGVAISGVSPMPSLQHLN